MFELFLAVHKRRLQSRGGLIQCGHFADERCQLFAILAGVLYGPPLFKKRFHIFMKELLSILVHILIL